jgi:drug/metabolite transporter (DMT)-like permease
VTAVLVGGAAALFWGVAGLVNGRFARLAGAHRTVAWSMLTGALVCGVIALSRGWPSEATHRDWLWTLGASAGAMAGLLLSYESYRRGKLGVVAPIVATQGAIAAVLSVLAGEPLDPVAIPVLAAMVVGVALAAAPASSPDAEVRAAGGLIAPLLALVSAVAFAASLFSAAQVGDGLHPFWIAWASRLFGLAAVVVPVAAVVGLRLERRVWSFAAVGGTLELGGLVSFVIAARDNTAVASVMASQFAIVTALGGFLLWGERLGRLQVVGVAVVLLAVAVLTALQA